tara:strand:+ start:3335 stop:4378 length:1044 start_codon:yes stop_codon:yes gene_type:complete
LKKLIYILTTSFLAFVVYLIFPFFNLFINREKKEILSDTNKVILKIQEDLLFSEIGDYLVSKDLLLSPKTINQLIEFKNYENNTLKEGKYIIQTKWSNNKLVNQLFLMRNQHVVDLYIPSVRNLEVLCGRLSSQLELDSAKLLHLFQDEDIQEKFGFDSYSFSSIVIPNTYEVFTNISENSLIEFIASKYKKFWNTERMDKANKIGYSQSKITILASIVQMEQQIKFDEHSKIAGLYINRLKKNMKLQADPTVKFALKMPNLRRLYYKHLEVDSPYNTYKYKGLPPGPICIVDPRVIDAVLNFSKHDYIFMCAKPSYSGYHNFSSTNKEHEKYKKMYTTWLSLEKIN